MGDKEKTLLGPLWMLRARMSFFVSNLAFYLQVTASYLQLTWSWLLCSIAVCDLSWTVYLRSWTVYLFPEEGGVEEFCCPFSLLYFGRCTTST